MFAPFILSLSFACINFKLKIIDSTLPGLEKILESVITFTSIIIGILIALFGVVVTLSDTDVMKKLQQNKGDRVIFHYSLETLVTNFIVLILSIVMQSLIEFDPSLGLIDFYVSIWFLFSLYSITSSIRTIYYLLLISFNQDNKSSRPNSSLGISDEERMALRANKKNRPQSERPPHDR